MRIWIDLSNSPHPLLFAPIARRLEELGNETIFTARDHAQTLDLAQERWPNVTVIGADSPKYRVGKVRVLAGRVLGLRAWAKGRGIDLALSHNSYAQIVAARSLGIPAVTAMDFEYQPANHLAFRLAQRVLVPDCLPERALRRQGADPAKVVRYPGLKEELYVGDFEPDSNVLSKLGIHRNDRTVVVVARTAPSRAAYHRFDNPLFLEALRTVVGREEVTCVALARFPEQRVSLSDLRLAGLIVPKRTVDSRSLLFAADAVLGAGGTMTREAAVMGVPTWSLYAGSQPEVDLSLERTGRLRRLSDATQLDDLSQRSDRLNALSALRERAAELNTFFVDAVLQTRTKGRWRWRR
jgi:uncharacterized protein